MLLALAKQDSRWHVRLISLTLATRVFEHNRRKLLIQTFPFVQKRCKGKKEEKKKKVDFKAFLLKRKRKTVESNGNCKTFLRY